MTARDMETRTSDCSGSLFQDSLAVAAEVARSRLTISFLRQMPPASKHVLERVVQPQFVELDVLFEAFERCVAGKLLEPCDVDALRDAARNRPAPEAVPGETSAIKAGQPGPFLDDERD